MSKRSQAPKQHSRTMQTKTILERSLLQEILLIKVAKNNGEFSHSEVSYFCLN